MSVSGLKCPSCGSSFSESAHTLFCNVCGVELGSSAEELISLSAGDSLPGGFLIDKCVGFAESLNYYAARDQAGNKLRIREGVVGHGAESLAAGLLSLSWSKLFPRFISAYSYGKRFYIVDQRVPWDTPYFAECVTADALIYRVRQFLIELSRVHLQGISAARMIESGVYLSDQARPLIGRGGTLSRIGEPVEVLPKGLEKAAFLPAVVEPCFDLIAMVREIWPALSVDESWEVVWDKALAAPSRNKRRDSFYQSLAFSPVVIEWPPLGEVLSDFMSDPAIWNTKDLLDRLTSSPPHRDTVVEVVSHRGLVRGNNEDSALANQYELWLEGIPTYVWLLVVADGMGGAGSGEVASRIAVETVDRLIHDFIVQGGLVLGPTQLRQAIEKANEAVAATRGTRGAASNMGTTIVAALVIGTRYVIGSVGDSRAYRVSDEGEFTQLTSDHTMVADLVRTGTVSIKEAENHPLASRLTRAIGLYPQVQVDILSGELNPKESLFLCSDGFNPALSGFTFPVKNTVKEGLDALTVRMLKSGGKDNATAVMIRVG